MISLLFAFAALQGAPPAASEEAQLRSCTETVRTDPEQAVRKASEWRVSGGGLSARHCLALAYVQLERWGPAATEFEQAAREAELKQDPRAAEYWTQSGNAWLAGGEFASARKALDAALATSSLTPELRGEVLFDRARAAFAADDVQAARLDIDKGLALVPSDPFGWYLSAALARQSDDLARARTDIGKAVTLAPDDADVLLEAGNISGLAGDTDIARAFYMRAIKASPQSPAGRAAQAAIVENGLEPASAAAPPDQSR
ncbi:tetratricopeptide repeat protein [Sphingosinicella rhizophila]|uniref:Tetratricopeptide repeat protein n=1 Tax=Sphingosinicella rhizophila TaxID=3050082 RepID=A0ABU3Q7V6_9SPHN|nr:hypothetical protein [Sphingosinicella sp. GR2756]MDT9599497.1 hypothetical protein [Sphingosinicella sp. GR2756]